MYNISNYKAIKTIYYPYPMIDNPVFIVYHLY